MSNKSYRVRYDFDNPMDHIKIDINQTFNTIDILSLKINQEGAYRLHTSNYGVLIGRVMANNGFGIPNAKVSLFIKNDGSDSTDTNIGVLYPYKSASQTNYDGIKYNLLPSETDKKCHQAVGTFPSKRVLLDNDSMIEVFDKYYKYTTRTNQSGDYMLFGVPTGSQEIHMDIDLSDIGVLSQAPRDFVYKGYNLKQFESPNKFKSGKDIGSLSQIISQDTNVFIYPFWGDDSYDEIAVSRKDFKIEYTFEPTCVFLGSIFTDSQNGYIGKSCRATSQSGKMSEITSSQGSIEMIRKRPDGSIETLEINGNRLIDDNGAWCYQIPMNLDYVITDEAGNLVPTTEYGKGIPTRAEVRFRVKLDDNGDETTQSKTASYLIPNNPLRIEDSDYNFNSSTKDGSFVNLMWNKVYSVKNYIPRVQGGVNVSNRKFVGLKSVNHSDSNNPAPYNNIWVNLNLKFILNCLLVNLLTKAVGSLNVLISKLHVAVGGVIGYTSFILLDTSLYGDDCPLLEGKEYYAPFNASKSIDMYTGSGGYERAIASTAEAYDIPIDQVYNRVYFGNKTGKIDIKMALDCSETLLSSDNDVINFDFFNDWVNGSLYAPRFQLKTKRDRNGKVKRVKYCGSKESYLNLKLLQSCAPIISEEENNLLPSNDDCGRNNGDCYKQSTSINVNGGLIARDVRNNIFYYRTGYPYSNTEGIKYAFLHATDVILLGSLSEKDLDGIPQLHQSLPSTSFKLPPDSSESEVESIPTTVYVIGTPDFNYEVQDYSDISLITELNNGDICYVQNLNTYYKYNNSAWEQIQPEDYPVIERKTNIKEYTNLEMSGIDWGNDYDGVYNFKNGLFTSIKCLNSITTLKTCVNASRLCEMGVDFDERFEYSDKNGVIIKKEVDGYVSDDEISDSNARSMFASLNINKLTVDQDGYGHKKYKLKYNFPSSFDGRMSAAIDSIANGFNGDTKSADYVTFRSGDDPYYYRDNQFKRFLNSFYFYFGFKNGKTAIDTFNTQYFVPCEDGSMSEDIGIVTFDITTTNTTYYNSNNGTLVISDIENNFIPSEGKYSVEVSNSLDEIVSLSIIEGSSITGNTDTLGIGEYSVKVSMFKNPDISGTRYFSIRSIGNVTTTEVTNELESEFTVGLKTVSNGNSDEFESGICYSTTELPTVSDNKVINTSNLTDFSTRIKNLTPDTRYFVRSYITNEVGTYYGAQVTGDTIYVNVATSGHAVSNDGLSATLYGYADESLLAGITEYGFKYGLGSTFSNTISGSTLGSKFFDFTVSPIFINSRYSYKAFITIDGNTYFGKSDIFYAIPTTPVVHTNSVKLTSVGSDFYVSYNCDVVNQGKTSVTERGVIYSTISNPELNTSGVARITNGSGIGSYSGLIPIMDNVQSYYFRAYATNLNGTSYGASIQAQPSDEIPTVVVRGVTSITKSSATINGEITNTGGLDISEHGIYWSATQNPTSSSEKVNLGVGDYGLFDGSMVGLNSNNTYYAILYATNSNGTAYSFQTSFRTLVEVTFKAYANNGVAYFNTKPVSRNGGSYEVPYGSDINIDVIAEEGWTAMVKHDNNIIGIPYTGSISNNMKNIEVIFVEDAPSHVTVSFNSYAESFGAATFNDMDISPAGASFTVEYGSSITISSKDVTAGYVGYVTYGPMTPLLPYTDNYITSNMLNLQITFIPI